VGDGNGRATCSNARRRSEGGGDGPRGLATPETDKVRKLQITLYRKAKAEPQYRFWSLYGEVLRKDVLEAAWKAVAENDGAPGVDGESIDTISKTAESRQQWLEALREELHTKSYRPSPVRRVLIPKRGGGERGLGIPTVKDRVVQAAVALVLMPIFEADFHDQSYGFRPKRGAHQAMEAIRAAVNTGRVEVLDADLTKYFDSIPHRELLRMVAQRVSDGSILALLRGWLRAPIVEEAKDGTKRIMPNKQGTPQGGVISPLLANLYLNPLDHQINEEYHKRHRMVRYADDFVVLSPVGQGGEVRAEIGQWLASKGLALNASKTRTVKVTEESITFLGFGLEVRRGQSGKSYPHIEVAGRSRQALREKLGGILNHRTRWRAIEEVVSEVNAAVRGWSGYFHYRNSARAFGKMQYWIDNRLRRWLWRKQGCRAGLYTHYTNTLLHAKHGVWRLPLTAAWTAQ